MHTQKSWTTEKADTFLQFATISLLPNIKGVSVFHREKTEMCLSVVVVVEYFSNINFKEIVFPL